MNKDWEEWREMGCIYLGREGYRQTERPVRGFGAGSWEWVTDADMPRGPGGSLMGAEVQ